MISKTCASKLYIKDKHNINLYNNEPIVFEKKYIGVYNYLKEIELFPIVLLNIVIDYLNYTYTVHKIGSKCVINILLLSRIINNSNDQELLNKSDEFIEILLLRGDKHITTSGYYSNQ